MALPHARRFTLADLCVALLVASVVLFGGLMPAVARLGRSEPRIKCASNLRQIGQAVQMYANENKGAYPRARFDGVGRAPTEFTRWEAMDPFAADGPGPNDVTAAMFLLVRTQDITTEVFVCPSSHAERWDVGDNGSQQRSNFPGRQYLSYSFANPYASPEAVAAGFRWDDSLSNVVVPADFAVAADMNPGPPAVVSVNPNSPRRAILHANSRNHNGDGQNVLYSDGHVEFQNTPFCGRVRTTSSPNLPQYRDNIYTYGAGHSGAAGVGVRGSPVDGLDSVLLPTALDGPAPQYPLIPNRPLTWVMAGLAGVVVLCVAVSLRLAFRRHREARGTGVSP